MEAASTLPHSDDVLALLAEIKDQKMARFESKELGQPLRDRLNALQIYHIELHKKIRETWFPVLA
jgi:hypothetical protein